MYTQHVLIYFAQLLFSFIFLLSAHCMLRLKTAPPVAPYFISFFLSTNLVGELTVFPILPNSIRLVLSFIVMPEMLTCHVALGSGCVQKFLYFGLTGSYLLHQISEITEVQMLSPNSVSIAIVSLILFVLAVEIMRRN